MLRVPSCLAVLGPSASILLAFSTRALQGWLTDHGMAILVVLVAALIVVRLLDHAIPAAIDRAVKYTGNSLTDSDLHKRADTLSAVLRGAARLAVLVVALLLIVDEFGVNVFPLIAGLGIGGIALGRGAQSFVRDAINGILILTENQYGKGDMISVAGVQGWVEEVNLRRTVLRDLDGTLHSVPNGEIKVASNLTRGFSGVNFVVSLAPGTDLGTATELIDRAGAELAADETLGAKVLEPPRAVRVEAITAGGVDVRVVGRVAPGAQWEVTSALRRRLLRAFEAAGIRFAVPPPAPVQPPSSAPPAR